MDLKYLDLLRFLVHNQKIKLISFRHITLSTTFNKSFYSYLPTKPLSALSNGALMDPREQARG